MQTRADAAPHIEVLQRRAEFADLLANAPGAAVDNLPNIVVATTTARRIGHARQIGPQQHIPGTQFQAESGRFDGSPPQAQRIARRQAEQDADPGVGVHRHPRRQRVHHAGLIVRRQLVEGRGGGRFQRGLPAELRARAVAQPVEDEHQTLALHLWRALIALMRSLL